MDEAFKHLKRTFKRYADRKSWNDAWQWFERNFEHLKQLADNEPLQRYLFAPLNELTDSFGNTTEGQVKATITRVAMANAVLAGLPGKLGVGVYVTMGLELWMAYRIASHVGIRLEKPGDIFRTFTAWTAVLGTIMFGFVHVLRGIFSLVSLLPPLVPATFVAELLATCFVGVMFWLAFDTARPGHTIDRRVLLGLLPDATRKTRRLFVYQLTALKQTCSPANLRLVAQRLRTFLIGDDRPSPARVRGESLASAAIAALLQGRVDQFEGPLGEVFLQSIRDRWAEVGANASAEEIGEFMNRQEYTQEQLEGVVNLIKGKMFEHLMVLHENADGDEWIARLHDDESFPGSDITLTDVTSGQEMEISLKATAYPGGIEEALLRYPDFPVVTTNDLADEFADDPSVSTVDWSSDDLEQITRSNLDALAAADASRFGVVEGLAAGTAGVRILLLWPIVASYLRRTKPWERPSTTGSLQREAALSELKSRLTAELGAGGVVLVKRLVLGVAFGPLYIWYLLARAVMELTPTVRAEESVVLLLEYVGGSAGRRSC